MISPVARSSRFAFKHRIPQGLVTKLFSLVFFCWFLVPLSNAHHIQAPENGTLLSVLNNVSLHDQSRRYNFDLAALESFEKTIVITSNPWIDGKAEFTGVRINTLLDSIGATSQEFEARALNDYSIFLNYLNFEKYPIIIAYRMNGKVIPIRELGPLWIILPFDDYPELLTEKNKAASVWQLQEIIIN